jgi:hypothetical protein
LVIKQFPRKISAFLVCRMSGLEMPIFFRLSNVGDTCLVYTGQAIKACPFLVWFSQAKQ